MIDLYAATCPVNPMQRCSEIGFAKVHQKSTIMGSLPPRTIRETLAERSRPIAVHLSELISRENQDIILDYRTLNPPPIFIYHPIYGKLLAGISDDLTHPPLEPQEFKNAADFVGRARMYGSIESLQLQDILYEELLSNCTTSIEDSSEFQPSPLLIKVKSADEETDPATYVERMYVDAYTSKEASGIRQACCCPTLLVACTGTYIQVLGAAFADHIIIQPLTGYISLLPHPGIRRGEPMGHAVLSRVALLFRALRAARAELDTYYADIVSSLATTHPNPSLIAPFWTQFVHPEHGPVFLEYTGRIDADAYPSRAVFTARVVAIDMEPTEVVVKFAFQYGVEGHALLAPDFSPRLWHCAWEESVGMWVIVMDHVRGSPLAEHEILTPTQGEKLRDAVGRLHAADLVFGDLRNVNVLTVGDDDIRLIDFDWCGKVGEARYPPDLYMGHDWPSGVHCGGLIEKAHDLQWVNELTGVE
ncbi:uncharacterized protein BXZ73DRAFT_105466 [Epithele typhae]|uniref:uncharacterized protein n=1 Tax=Epithele typhae TaxID=378194 RepID=UPI0020085EEB|nr:uncharacterized protein BXZ73DRAFT_105466 [Epithele typhae]KAH9917642.1 hypothetical protein BXZ73DRAFT_105466 [Epithele typhae]